MKKAGTIVLFVSGILYGVFGLAWFVLVLVTLCRGDASVYSDAAAGYSGLLLRLVRSAFYVSLGVLPCLLLGKKEHPIITIYVYVFAVTAFVLEEILSSLASLKGDVSFLGNYVPLIFAIVYFAGAVLLFVGSKPVAQKAEPQPAAVPDTTSEKKVASVTKEEAKPSVNEEAPKTATKEEPNPASKAAPEKKETASKGKWSLKTKAAKKE
jgi:hypothetical protein